jgi:hypothetical protein
MAAMHLKPAVQVHGSARTSFRGLTSSFQQLNVSQQAVARSSRLQVEGACMRLVMATHTATAFTSLRVNIIA